MCAETDDLNARPVGEFTLMRFAQSGKLAVDRAGTATVGRAIWGADAAQCERCGVAYDASRFESCPRCREAL